MLDIKGVIKTFNPGSITEKKALRGIELHLNDGDFVTIIGGNGAGKSTMLNAIAGVWKPDYGTIELDGVDVTGMPEHKRAAFLGRVFQDPMKGTAPDMEIAENLSIAARRGTKRKLLWRIRKGERERYKKTVGNAGIGSGRPAVLQGGSAVRRTAAGGDPADGHTEQAQAAASG